jgi:hypothetical protein
MKRLTAFAIVSAALAGAPLTAATPAQRMSIAQAGEARPGLVRKNTAAVCNGICYSAELAVVTRVQGTAFFRTSIDISNNLSNQSILATYQYTYVFNGQVFHTAPQTLTLLALSNFHQDDIVAYLGTQNLLQPGADQSSFGTFLVTFDNLPSKNGWEGTVTARTYSPDPSGVGTNGIAYPGTLFFESANQTLVGTIRDTLPAPTFAGALRTNMGIRNTDINGLGDAFPVTVQVTFWDVTEGSPTNGQKVGQDQILSGILPGEVSLLNDVFVTAGIPQSVTSCIAFVDVIAPTSGFPTVEGYINILDNDTKDGSFFELKCADTDGCGN